MNSPAGGVPRVVVDTSVLLRALLSKQGPSARLYRFARSNAFRILLSPHILRELRVAVLRPHVRRRYPLSLKEIADFLADLQVVAEAVPGRLHVHGASSDPKDNPILASALEGHADYVVTDDRKHLLPLKHYRGVQIVSAPAFLRVLAGH